MGSRQGPASPGPAASTTSPRTLYFELQWDTIPPTTATSRSEGVHLCTSAEERPDLEYLLKEALTELPCQLTINENLNEETLELIADTLKMHTGKIGDEMIVRKLHSIRLTSCAGLMEGGELTLREDDRVRVRLYRFMEQYTEDIDDLVAGSCEAEILPRKKYTSLWNSLYYNDDVKEKLLTFAESIMTMHTTTSDSESTTHTQPMPRLILLHGPPGGGKTSLALALSQKLSIRLSHIYSHALLLRLSASTLLSQYFGQTAHQMSSLFESICQLAERHAKSPTHSDRAFLVILIDEVESIAACRRKAAARGEVHEAVRATNALLTGLDRVMGMANVLVLATSNLYDAIDAAFIDRCGLVETIGLPDARSRYNILFRAIRGLVERGVVREGVHTLGRWPRYDMAAYGSEVGYLKPEQMLRRIADRFDDPELVHHPQISGRMLAALPGTILATGGNLAEDNRVDVSELVARMSQHLRKAYPKRTVPDGVDAAMGSGGTGSADRNRDGHGSENGEVRNMNGKRTFERPLEGDDIDVLYYEFRKRVVREFGLVPTDLRNMSGRDAI